MPDADGFAAFDDGTDPEFTLPTGNSDSGGLRRGNDRSDNWADDTGPQPLVSNRPPSSLDRTWRHPAEIGREAATLRAREPRKWHSAALVAGSLGVAVVAGFALISVAGTRTTRSEQFRWLANGGDSWHPNGDEVRTAQRARKAIVKVTSSPSLIEGTGVVIDGRGYILTSAGLIADALSVAAHTDSGSILTARVVGADADSDLALIKVSTNELTALELAPAPNVGLARALAVAAPPVQGAGLWLAVSDLVPNSGGSTATSPTNMTLGVQLPTLAVGAPVLDPLGRVLGIVHQLSAAPLSARNVMPNMPSRLSPRETSLIVATERFEPQIARWIMHDQSVAGWFGATCVDFDGLVNEGGLHTQGALVAAIESGSPADIAGLAAGDVVLQVNDIVVPDEKTFVGLVSHLRPGDNVRLRIVRDGEGIRLGALIAAPPDN